MVKDRLVVPHRHLYPRAHLHPRDSGTTATVTHSGLLAPEAAQHRLGWAHFLERLITASSGGDPGPDPGRKRRQPAHSLAGAG